MSGLRDHIERFETARTEPKELDLGGLEGGAGAGDSAAE